MQVVFAVKTKNQDDLDFLDQLMARNPGVYHRSDKGERVNKESMEEFHEFYSLALPGRIYVKIDDDVIFIQVCDYLLLLNSTSHSTHHLIASGHAVGKLACLEDARCFQPLLGREEDAEGKETLIAVYKAMHNIL
jgi:hypothetical protein